MKGTPNPRGEDEVKGSFKREKRAKRNGSYGAAASKAGGQDAGEKRRGGRKGDVLAVGLRRWCE